MATSRGVDRHVTHPGNAPKARPSHLTTADEVNRDWRTRLRRPQRPGPSKDADPELGHQQLFKTLSPQKWLEQQRVRREPWLLWWLWLVATIRSTGCQLMKPQIVFTEAEVDEITSQRRPWRRLVYVDWTVLDVTGGVHSGTSGYWVWAAVIGPQEAAIVLDWSFHFTLTAGGGFNTPTGERSQQNCLLLVSVPVFQSANQQGVTVARQLEKHTV